ncbi:DUF1338 domain-containing protein [Bacteriovoracaceae bacterium]|nr:DUF1338 domain-containing protein [Bacteriovoracaceae bacterium]
MKLNDYFQIAWDQYIETTPSAKKINDLLSQRGESVVNDHIAFRTFDNHALCMDRFIEFFKQYDYEVCGDYVFEEKKLDAVHLENKDKACPKIFISQLQNNNFSKKLQRLIKECVESEDFDFNELLISGSKNWHICYDQYQMALEESEYAAWVLAHGIRPNHFTVLVNELSSFSGLGEFNSFLKENSFEMNTSGGEIKGNPAVYLEQSSTMADSIHVDFDGETHQVASCFYEFAKRYPIKEDILFQGFVTSSADRIFESTNKVIDK